jgi:4-hydroxy-3-polyprenylbenzoate decarboxylase
MARYVVGISGASGAILAKKAIECLITYGHEVELVITKSALRTIQEELGQDAKKFTASLPSQIHLHDIDDMASSIASGSFEVAGTLIIPCSMATIAALSVGLADNLLRRAADVALKERRPLVLVPREMPLHALHLENMAKLAHMGVTIAPPMPAWYMRPKALVEVEDFIVARVLSCLGVKVEYSGWTGPATELP